MGKRDNLVPCKTCKNQIIDGAKICTHCDTYQGIRRYFNFGSSLVPILSVLLALVSFLYGIRDEISEYFEPPNAKLYFEASRLGDFEKNADNPEQGIFTIMNVGKRSALVQGSFACDSSSLSHITAVVRVVGSRVIEPGKVSHIEYSVSILDEERFDPTYEGQEALEAETAVEIESVHAEVPDPLGNKLEYRNGLNNEELSEYEERLNEYYSGIDNAPEWEEQRFENGLIAALEPTKCAMKELAFNTNAFLELSSMDTIAHAALIELIKSRRKDQDENG